MVNDMKSKAIAQLVLLSLLCLVATPIVQSAKPGKLVEHYVSEEPFNGGWCKMVFHGTMIVKDEIPDDPTLYNVKVTMLQKFILYEYDGGDIVAVVKLTLQYVGKVTTFELPEDEDPTEAFYTGKMVVDVVVNVIGEMADAPENAHWVVWYEEGDVIKYNGFGELPF